MNQQQTEISKIGEFGLIDRLTDGQQSSRINYESVEFNKKIPDSIFSRPANVKEMKKDLKL